jgi:hypothetical protein
MESFIGALADKAMADNNGENDDEGLRMIVRALIGIYYTEST